MDGVTILNQIEDVSGFPLGIILIILCFAAMVLSIYAICLMIKEKSFEALFFPIIAIIISVMAFGAGICNINESPHINYEVTISDEVSFKDFTNKYEVIEQRGEIYVVKER